MNKLALVMMVVVGLTGCALDGSDDDETSQPSKEEAAQQQQTAPPPAAVTQPTQIAPKVLKTRHD